MFRSAQAVGFAAVVAVSFVTAAQASGQPSVTDEFMSRCEAGSPAGRYYDCACLRPVVQRLSEANPADGLGMIENKLTPDLKLECLNRDKVAARAQLECEQNFQFGMYLNFNKLPQEQLCACHAVEAVKAFEKGHGGQNALPAQANEICGAAPYVRRAN